jgi:hypothetical protein
MLRAMSTAHEQTKRMAIICAGAFVALNVAFYFLSGSYFGSHREIVGGVSVSSYSPEQMAHVRMSFAVFSGVVAACGFAAGIWARTVGHLLPVLFGAGHLAASVGAFANGAPLVVGAVLALSGLLLPVLAWSSYRHARPAWAFLVAMCGVFAVAEFFGAPKIRDALGGGLWIAMIFPGLNAVAVAALLSLRGEYVERDPVAA